MVKAKNLRKHFDARGHFAEIFRASDHNMVFIQDSVSFSRTAGTLRGLHGQVGPSAQSQMLTIMAGRILDVVVELDRGRFEISYNYMDPFGDNQIVIPPGALHGFVTLVDDVALLYKSDRYFEAGIDKKVNPFDTTLSIDWHITTESAILADADRFADSYEKFMLSLENKVSLGRGR
jgi:dTDP-4-dehydrorhamnose 3,5-epimerase